MRAYVIQGFDYNTHGPHEEAAPVVLGLASSKKHAMQACEHWLNGSKDSGKVVWKETDKHDGYAKKGEFVATYKMFFINQLTK